MENEKVYNMQLAKIYPLLVNKITRKGRSEDELIQIITWLTGYTKKDIDRMLDDEITYEIFFKQAPMLNPNRKLIKGVICNVRVENIEDPLMQEIRYLDKLVDELAKGKSIDKILRK